MELAIRISNESAEGGLARRMGGDLANPNTYVGSLYELYGRDILP